MSSMRVRWWRSSEMMNFSAWCFFIFAEDFSHRIDSKYSRADFSSGILVKIGKRLVFRFSLSLVNPFKCLANIIQ